uniref:Cadherin domain-containing protein n=1 Tax=Ditylenchus dipsaci TaxID=166011 RepID=A0A915DLI3_9BILA
PIYAFAVGPGGKELGSIRVSRPSTSTVYGISEGGASYFSIDPQTGQLFYGGPLEKNTKNYTIKAIATEKETNRVDSASVQILVAGIGSSPPQFASKLEIVEIPQNSPTDKIVHTVAAMDFDADARLIYRIVEADCLTVLGQTYTRSITLSKLLNENESTIEDGSIQNKIFALAVVHLNISVSDSNHPLEPSTFVSYIIRIKPKISTENKSHDDNDQMTSKFSFPSSDNEIHHEYRLFIGPCTKTVCAGFTHWNPHFNSFPQRNWSGECERCSQRLNTDQLMVIANQMVVQSNKSWLPEFRQQFYLFEANAANQSENSGVVIGQVNAEDKEGMSLATTSYIQKMNNTPTPNNIS